MHLYIEPQAGSAPVVQVIDSARHAVHMEVYFLSDGKVLRALANAHDRGVQVEVILDHHPYGLPAWKVRKEAEKVRQTGASLRWAPQRFEAVGGQYVYEHGKWTCNQRECEIGTGNYGWYSFHHDRDYDLVTSNPSIVRAANMVFTADWNNQRAGNYPHRVLVLSPDSAGKILQVIRQPGPIIMESEELGDYRPILEALAAKGKEAKVLLLELLSVYCPPNQSISTARPSVVRKAASLAAKTSATRASCAIGKWASSSTGKHSRRSTSSLPRIGATVSY